MLAIAGIQGIHFCIPAGIYPDENRGWNEGRMGEPLAFQVREDSISETKRRGRCI